MLLERGYSSVPSRDGVGSVWTKQFPDENTVGVRMDPANTRRNPPRGYADEVPHAHKETVPSSDATNGNYGRGTTYDDNGVQTNDRTRTHIPIDFYH